MMQFMLQILSLFSIAIVAAKVSQTECTIEINIAHDGHTALKNMYVCIA